MVSTAQSTPKGKDLGEGPQDPFKSSSKGGRKTAIFFMQRGDEIFEPKKTW